MAKGFLDGYQTYDASNGHGNAKKWRKALYERMSKKEADEILERIQKWPYKILEIAPGATHEEIKKAYRKQLMKWHPDQNPEMELYAQAQTIQIIAAYQQLTEQ